MRRKGIVVSSTSTRPASGARPGGPGLPAGGSSWKTNQLADASSGATAQGSQRVTRGGSWDNAAAFVRSAQRSGGNRDGGVNNVGFRVARDEARAAE